MLVLWAAYFSHKFVDFSVGKGHVVLLIFPYMRGQYYSVTTLINSHLKGDKTDTELHAILYFTLSNKFTSYFVTIC